MKKIFLIAIFPLLSIVIFNSCVTTFSTDPRFRRHVKNLVEIPQDTMTVDFLSFQDIDSNKVLEYEAFQIFPETGKNETEFIDIKDFKIIKISPSKIKNQFRSKNENESNYLYYYLIYDSVNKFFKFDNSLLFAQTSFNNLYFKFSNKIFLISSNDRGPLNDDDSSHYYDAIVAFEQEYSYKHKLKKLNNCERIAIVMPSDSNLRVIVQILKRISTCFYAPAFKGIHPVAEFELVPVKLKEYIIDKDLNIISSRFIEFEQI